jgi:hypothetical protein
MEKKRLDIAFHFFDYRNIVVCNKSNGIIPQLAMKNKSFNVFDYKIRAIRIEFLF